MCQSTHDPSANNAVTIWLPSQVYMRTRLSCSCRNMPSSWSTGQTTPCTPPHSSLSPPSQPAQSISSQSKTCEEKKTRDRKPNVLGTSHESGPATHPEYVAIRGRSEDLAALSHGGWSAFPAHNAAHPTSTPASHAKENKFYDLTKAGESCYLFVSTFQVEVP